MRHGREDEAEPHACRCYESVAPGGADNNYNLYEIAIKDTIDEEHTCIWTECTHSYDGYTTTDAATFTYVCPQERNHCRNYL